ncbi:MAG: EAL domain-containing protein [Acidimicrobiales bacterium]|jgi:diguanylate cyclase (GGDEF)-like protein/PAS domain S-box-containing protein
MQWPGQVPAWALLGLSAVAAVAYGVKRGQPRSQVGWWLLGGGVLLLVASDTTYKFWHQIIGRQHIPFPSFIDPVHLAVYPVLAAGLLILAREQVPDGDRASLLDGLTITLGVGVLFWVFLIGPNLRAPGGVLTTLTAAAYPLGDVLVLAMLARLWSAGGMRYIAGRLLAIAILGALLADSLYELAKLHPGWGWSGGNVFDLGWIVFFACSGAAALHPSMGLLSGPKPVAPLRTSRSRMRLLAGVSLVAPALLLGETLRGDVVDAPVIAGIAGIMFLLVISRMTSLVGVHGQAVAREQVLRRSVASLLAASDRDAIYQATVAGIRELVFQDGNDFKVAFAVANTDGEPVVVMRSGHGLAEAPQSLTALWERARKSLADGDLESHLIATFDRRNSPTEQGLSEELVCPLIAKGQLQGLVVVTSAAKFPFELRSSIEIVAAQAAMAIARETMTEAFHARRSEARFQTLVQNASDVILIARPDTTITYQTPSANRIFGYADGSLEGKQFTSLLHPDDVEQALAGYSDVALRAGTSISAKWRLRHCDGSWRHVEVTTTNLLHEPTLEGIVLTLRDVSERTNLEEELKHQAFHDALSGLANRALFRDRLEHALARASRSKSSLAVLFLDLDDFKLINDSLGHAAGDALLVAVSRRLSECLRSGDTVARFGGDEFAVLLEETTGPEEACQTAERLIRALRETLVIEDHDVQVCSSVGIALSHAGREDPTELMQAADLAMYAAKTHGKGRYEVYQPDLQVAIVRRLDMTADLQRAIEAREFVVYYQPIVSLGGGNAVGLEALVRWRHPEHGLLLPEEFIALAEDTGLVIPLDRWVLKEACIHTREWQYCHSDARRLWVSVNISARHFQDEGLVEAVSMALRESGLDPQFLVLEITEGVFVQEAESVIERMLELKALGIRFAIDDFGTGYSSLSYLRRFPIDILKLDKSFVDGVAVSAEDGALAETIVRLGKNLNLQTIAEGIEHAPQLEALRALGCQLGQGFYFNKGLQASEVDDLLLRNSQVKSLVEAVWLETPSLTEEIVT